MRIVGGSSALMYRQCGNGSYRMGKSACREFDSLDLDIQAGVVRMTGAR